MHKNQQVDFDLVIIGGGLVGATLALSLMQSCPHLRLLVLEQKEPTPADNENQHCHDFNQKTLAINQGTKLFFDNLGIWPEEVNTSGFLTPIKQVKVSMQKALGQFHFHSPKNYDALGYIIQIKLLENLLLARLQEKCQSCKMLTWVQPSTQVAIKPITGGWQVAYLDVAQNNKPMTINTKCVIGSDGPHSLVKKSLGISDSDFDYGHTAIIANVKLNQHHDYIAYERFTQEGGALALLPYGSGEQMTMVLTMPSQLAKCTQDLTAEDFLAKLKNLMGGRLAFEAITNRIQVPLNMKIAKQQIARRALLMGNSAHFLHPIAAQGFNLSIQDIASLVNLFTQNTEQAYIGSAAMLNDYDKARKTVQQDYIQTTDKIATYYSSQRLPTWLKGMSLLCLDNLSIKQYFTEKSMGIA